MSKLTEFQFILRNVLSQTKSKLSFQDVNNVEKEKPIKTAVCRSVVAPREQKHPLVPTITDFNKSKAYNAYVGPMNGFELNPAVYVESLTKSEKLVLGEILFWKTRTGQFYSSHDYIAHKHNISKKTVLRAMKKFKEDEVLDYQKRRYRTCIYRITREFLRPTILKSLVSTFEFLRFLPFMLLSILPFDAISKDNVSVLKKKDKYKYTSLRNNEAIGAHADLKKAFSKNRELKEWLPTPQLYPEEKTFLRRDTLIEVNTHYWHDFFGVPMENEPPRREHYNYYMTKAQYLPTETFDQRVKRRTQLTIAKVRDDAAFRTALRQYNPPKREQFDNDLRKKDDHSMKSKKEQCAELIPSYIKNIPELRLTCYGQIFLSIFPSTAISFARIYHNKDLTGLEAFNRFGYLCRTYCKQHELELNHDIANKICKIISIPKDPKLVFEESESVNVDFLSKTIPAPHSESSKKKEELNRMLENGAAIWNKQRNQSKEPVLRHSSRIPYKAKEIELEHVCIYYHRFEEYLNSEKGKEAMKLFSIPNPHIKRYQEWLNEPGNTIEIGLAIYQKHKDNK